MYSQRAPVPAILRLSLVCPSFHHFFFCVSSLLCLPLPSCNCSSSLYPSPSAVLGITKRCNGKWGKDISRVVYDCSRKEFDGVDVWILRFCVRKLAVTPTSFRNIPIRDEHKLLSNYRMFWENGRI